jgi:hypothetical protein
MAIGGTAVAVTVAGASDEGQAAAPYTVQATVAAGQWKAHML